MLISYSFREQISLGQAAKTLQEANPPRHPWLPDFGSAGVCEEPQPRDPFKGRRSKPSAAQVFTCLCVLSQSASAVSHSLPASQLGPPPVKPQTLLPASSHSLLARRHTHGWNTHFKLHNWAILKKGSLRRRDLNTCCVLTISPAFWYYFRWDLSKCYSFSSV